MTTTPRTATGYIRVSTADQAENGVSLAAQRKKIEAYCEVHDLVLTEVITDEGVSGKSLFRQGVQELLRKVRRRETDAVVVAKLDRITRSVRDLGDLVEIFQKAKVEFSSIADHIDTSTAAGRLVLNVMGSVSQWEREAIGERTRDALSYLRSKGRRVARHAPFGWKTVGDTWVEEPREQAGICLLRQLKQQGHSLRRIALEAEKHGVTNRRGDRLAAKVVRSILQREEEGRAVA